MLKHRLYTLPDFWEGEGRLLNGLFEQGLPCLHLRKPESSLEACQVLLEEIHPVYHQKIMMHQHWELVELFELGGIHWTESTRVQHPNFIKKARQQTVTYQVGTAIHHPQQLVELPDFLDYVTVSPVFESISKPNYQPAYLWKNNGEYPFSLVALGGVKPSNLARLQELGFEEVALLGAIWQPLERVLQNYQDLCQALQQL